MENFKLNHWFIDIKSCMVTTQDEDTTILLTQREMELLLYLCQRPNQVITTEELIGDIWSGQQTPDNNLLDTILSLKDTFKADLVNPSCIETIPHIGYRLLATPELITPPQSQQGSFNAFAFERNRPKLRNSLFSSAGLFALVIFITMIVALAAIGLS